LPPKRSSPTVESAGDLAADLLDRTPEEGARLLALHYLGHAEIAVPRIANGTDAEALHDFRVAIRRLRSVLRAYRPFLRGSANRKLRDSLRELGAATNAGRDAEVQLEWLQSQEVHFRGRKSTGHRWLREFLEERRDTAYERARTEVVTDLAKVADKLRERLSVYAIKVRIGEPVRSRSLAEAASTVVAELAQELRARLGAVHSLSDQEQAHEARISAKKLRYVLEPLARDIESVKPIVRRIKALQEVLGEMHDMHVLALEVGTALELAAAGRARKLHAMVMKAGSRAKRVSTELRRDERPGLLEIARHVHQREGELFLDLANHWLADHGDAFHRAVDDIVRELAERGLRHTEIERKYLLRRMPDEAQGAPSVEITQGWLPGTELRERLRRTKSASGVRFFRAVKLGKGIRRVEIEEATTPELFRRLWPLTDGRRVTKRRYAVEHDGLVWEIDVFSDRKLVLAEVELRSEDIVPVPPEWLAPHIVREVTGESQYVNANLAK